MRLQLKTAGILLALLATTACSSMDYYMQAIGGHLDLVSREQPIKDILQQQDVDEELKRRLRLALQAREFATIQLSLPDNDSYKNYADLERPYVVWSVVATPPYSVKPKQWCFFVVGCLSYRGYFNKQDADELVAELKQQGMDAHAGGTLAYSTLGYFDDPLVNTMLKYDDASLIGLIFHELAHQVVHVDHDTAFNEAFATAVEQEGLRRWFELQGNSEQYQKYLQKKQRRHEFFSLLKGLREELDQVFQQEVPDEQKEIAKVSLYKAFKQDYAKWAKKINYRGFDNWINRELNNSHLASIATYYDLVPMFSRMLHSVNGDFQKFYALVNEVGEKEKLERQKLLLAYLDKSNT